MRAEIDGTNPAVSLAVRSFSVEADGPARGVGRNVNTDSAFLRIDGLDKCFCSVRLGVGHTRKTVCVARIGVYVSGDAILRWRLLLNATLNSPSWVADGGIEVDHSSSALTGGTVMRSGFARGSESINVHTDTKVLIGTSANINRCGSSGYSFYPIFEHRVGFC